MKYNPQLTHSDQKRKVADEISKDIFGWALCTVVSGSVAEGRATNHSDIDLIIITDGTTYIFKDKFEFKGHHFEVAVVSIQLIAEIFFDEYMNAVAPTVNMIANAKSISDVGSFVPKLKTLAANYKVDEQSNTVYINKLVGRLERAISDLNSVRNDMETFTIISDIVSHICKISLLEVDSWGNSHTKHLIRYLENNQPKDFKKIRKAVSGFTNDKNKSAIIEIARSVIGKYEGKDSSILPQTKSDYVIIRNYLEPLETALNLRQYTVLDYEDILGNKQSYYLISDESKHINEYIIPNAIKHQSSGINYKFLINPPFYPIDNIFREPEEKSLIIRWIVRISSNILVNSSLERQCCFIMALLDFLNIDGVHKQGILDWGWHWYLPFAYSSEIKDVYSIKRIRSKFVTKLTSMFDSNSNSVLTSKSFQLDAIDFVLNMDFNKATPEIIYYQEMITEGLVCKQLPLFKGILELFFHSIQVKPNKWFVPFFCLGTDIS